SAHARDLEVLLTIPSLGGRVLPWYDLPDAPEEPEPLGPEIPGRVSMFSMPEAPEISIPEIPEIPTIAELLTDPVVGPDITVDGDGWTIRYHVRSLPPKRRIDLDDV